MGILIDIILILIVLLSIFLAYRKGLIKTIFSFFGTILALILAFLLSGPVGSVIDKNFVNPPVKTFVTQAVDESEFSKLFDTGLEGLNISKELENLPEPVESLLEFAGIDINALANRIEYYADQPATAKNQMIESIAAPVSGTISKVIAVVILFVIFFILVFVASRLLSAIFNTIPIGKQINKTGGAIIGFLRGIVLLFLITFALNAFANLIPSDSGSILSQEAVESSFIVSGLDSINPLNTFLN